MFIARLARSQIRDSWVLVSESLFLKSVGLDYFFQASIEALAWPLKLPRCRFTSIDPADLPLSQYRDFPN
jgi:hypothetical protein